MLLVSLPPVPVVRSVFDQLEQLVRLLLVIPESSCEAEHIFFSLLRLTRSTAEAVERPSSVNLLHAVVSRHYNWRKNNFNLEV